MAKQVNWKAQAGLATGLFVLGMGAYWLEFKHKPQSENKEEQSRKLFQLKDTQVQSISVTGPKGSVQVSCLDMAAKLCKPGNNSKWELLEPLKSKADDSNTNSLLSTLNNLNVSETIDLKDETPEKRGTLLKDYGLDPESLNSPNVRKVVVTTPAGQTVAYFGATHPIGDSIFAAKEEVAASGKPSGKVDDSRIFLVPSYFKTNFDRDLTYWREKKLLTIGSHEVETFELSGKKGKVSGKRGASGQWTIQSGGEELAGDLEGIESLLSGASYLSAKNFVADRKTDTAAKDVLKGAAPVLTLTLNKEKTPEPVTLTLLQKTPSGQAEKLYATVSNVDPLFELEPTALKQLDKSAKDLRLSKLITSVERFAAKKLEFSGKPLGANSLTLVLSDGKWVNSADKKEVDGEKVQATLDKLSGNRIKDFLTGAAIPAGESDGLQLIFGDDKSDSKHQYVFWKNGNQLYARDLKSNRKEAFLVDNAVQEGLPWDRSYFNKTEPPKAAK